jgi:hypothetical protein
LNDVAKAIVIDLSNTLLSIPNNIVLQINEENEQQTINDNINDNIDDENEEQSTNETNIDNNSDNESSELNYDDLPEWIVRPGQESDNESFEEWNLPHRKVLPDWFREQNV